MGVPGLAFRHHPILSLAIVITCMGVGLVVGRRTTVPPKIDAAELR